MTTSNSKAILKNSHLEGGPFLWEAMPTGVLLVHGFTATTAEVRPIAKALHENGYSVSGPVLPGHNTYPEEINKFTWRDWVSSVEQAYQELKTRCNKVFVGGESTGGLITLWIATQHPEISGILSYAPALKINISIFDQIILRMLSPFIPYRPKSGEDDNLPWKGYTVNPLKGVIQLLELQKEVRPRLHRINHPLLIVQGRLDTTVDESVPQMIYDEVNSVDKEIHWMDKSGHCVILDRQLDQVTEITLKFLEKHQ